jgi:hypothetical protein
VPYLPVHPPMYLPANKNTHRDKDAAMVCRLVCHVSVEGRVMAPACWMEPARLMYKQCECAPIRHQGTIRSGDLCVRFS